MIDGCNYVTVSDGDFCVAAIGPIRVESSARPKQNIAFFKKGHFGPDFAQFS